MPNGRDLTCCRKAIFQSIGAELVSVAKISHSITPELQKIFDLGVIESYKKCDHFLLLVQVLSADQVNALGICCWFHKQSGVLLFSQ